MEFASSIAEAQARLQTYLIGHGAALPDFTRDRVIEAASSPSPVDAIVQSAEALYAIAADLDNAGRETVAVLIAFAAQNGWHGLPIDNRGGRMMMAMRRMNGEEAPAGLPWPDAESDPAPKPEFVAPAPVELPVA